MSYHLLKISCLALAVGGIVLLKGCTDDEEMIIQQPMVTASQTVSINPVAEGLNVPWSMVDLPDIRHLLVAEKTGEFVRLDADSGKIIQRYSLPAASSNFVVTGQGGLLDIVLTKDFSDSGVFYYSHAAENEAGDYTTQVVRAQLTDTTITNAQVIFVAQPYLSKSHHFGSRLVIHDGYLFVAVGDRGNRDLAQSLTTHNGKIMRLNLDGSVPDDNPFVNQADARPEIWSYGHRNIQGMKVNPADNKLWAHEHGPQGGDELNIIQPGRNYGWPVITYGKEYVTGFSIGEGTSKPGMEQPVKYYVPSIAPSGLIFYDGQRFPEWQGDALIGALKLTHINRVSLDEGKAVNEERLFDDQNPRVRALLHTQDDRIFFSTDTGRIFEIMPANTDLAYQ